MIIVSQGKKAIVNYENIVVLGIGNPLENNNGVFPIIANAITDNQYILGEYKTEERAKEVLLELINRIVLTERFEAICIPERQDNMVIDMYNNNRPLFVYEMPEE